MAATLVQSKSGDVAGATSYTLAFNSNITAGNAIVVVAICYNLTLVIGNLSDTLNGATYSLADEHHAHTGTSILIGSKHNSAGGACSVTVNPASTSESFVLVLMEFSGVPTTALLSGTPAKASGSSTSPASGSFTPADNGFAIGAMSHESGTTTLGVGSGWTQVAEVENATNIPYNVMWRATTASSAINADYTASGSVNWIVVGAAFKETAAAGGAAAPQRGLLGVY